MCWRYFALKLWRTQVCSITYWYAALSNGMRDLPNAKCTLHAFFEMFHTFIAVYCNIRNDFYLTYFLAVNTLIKLCFFKKQRQFKETLFVS